MSCEALRISGAPQPPCPQAIYEKQGHSAEFASEAERDAWVNKEVAALKKSLAAKQANQAELDGQFSAANAGLTQRQQVLLKLLVYSITLQSSSHAQASRFVGLKVAANAMHGGCEYVAGLMLYSVDGDGQTPPSPAKILAQRACASEKFASGPHLCVRANGRKRRPRMHL